ncbi:MAG: right-handed parallel beta-helix repeat-containing protein [Myxococcota bacterium]|nr:right-handed parallel beta-helix repeat-containing protein [Myxococcota bacterium]
MRWLRWTLLLPISACAFISDDVEQWRLDPDGDGVSLADDCDSDDADIGAAALWYMDLDGDGYGDPGNTTTACTQPEDSSLNSTDCWDDPDNIPADFVALNDLPQPAASAVYPGADNVPYDGIDQGCTGDVNDFDLDGDGYPSARYADRSGAYGDDCIDGSELDSDNFAGLDPEDVNPEAVEVWYDGTDADCDNNDCDADEDGFDGGVGSAYCEEIDCDDVDSDVRPDKSIDEIPYNGIDDNCDVSVGDGDGDADGDGFWAADYADRVAEPLEIPAEYAGDCWDDQATKDAALIPINGGTQLTADAVYPGAVDAPYDAVDADCAADSDFDADGDGYDYDGYADRDGSTGSDCYDAVDQPTDYENDAGLQPGEVNPAAVENYYDGSDANCDGNDDDQDEDGYDYLTDCDDYEATTNPGASETVGDGVDSDCDGGEVCYVDADDDGYRPDSTSTIVSADADCDDAGEALSSVPTGDCYDTISTAYPKAPEVCDGVDSGCDGVGTDDGLITLNGTTNFTTIQDAIDSAGAGEAVAVCAGDYEVALTLSAALTLTAPSGPTSTILRSDASGPVITVDGASVTIDGFTLTGGIGVADPNGPSQLVGGGLAVLSADTVTLTSVTIEGNHADQGGGVYATSGAELILETSTFTANEADEGGGVYLAGASATVDVRTSIADNAAVYVGGGVVMTDGSSWSGGSVSDNTSTDGGGFYIEGDVVVSDVNIETNAASEHGGGVVVISGEVQTSGVLLEDNESIYGGGFYLVEGTISDDATSKVTSCLAAYGGGFYSDDTSTLDTLTFTDNTATFGAGGYVLSGALTLVSSSVLLGSSQIGGGVYLASGTLTSDATDWGSSSTDNAPTDVYVNGIGSYNYSGSSTFDCDTTSGCY